MVRSRLALVVVPACALLPSLALASNMTHPRTPVEWDGVPCMTLHDRSQGASFHLDYDIPFEDLDVTPDEVADSRRHQFFAYCRPHHPQDFLPTWITQADVDAAVAKNLLSEGTVEPSDILEGNAAWADCWFRLNADDDRRPISFDMAAMGVDWDTSGVPAGAYTLYGYTYEPVFNIWTLRPGVMKLHDGDPDAIGPAGAITTGELTPYRNDMVVIEGCVDGLDGTTFTAYWALTAEDPEWVAYVEDQPTDGDGWMFEFTPPEAIWGESAMIRVDFDDPMGRSYTTYQSTNMLVINADNPDSCDQGGSFIGSPCSGDSSGGESGSGDSGESGSGDAGSSGEAGSGDASGPMQTGGDDGSDPKGCSCTSEPQRGAPLSLVVLLGLLARRRRAA